MGPCSTVRSPRRPRCARPLIDHSARRRNRAPWRVPQRAQRGEGAPPGGACARDELLAARAEEKEEEPEPNLIRRDRIAIHSMLQLLLIQNCELDE